MADRTVTDRGYGEKLIDLNDSGAMGFASPQPYLAYTLLASAAVAAAGTVTGSAITGFGCYRKAVFLLDVTAAATEANDTLDVYIDLSVNAGTTWTNVVHFTQVVGNGGAKQFAATLSAETPGTSVIATSADAAAGAVRPTIIADRYRVRHVIVDPTGSNVSFTFGVYGFFQG